MLKPAWEPKKKGANRNYFLESNNKRKEQTKRYKVNHISKNELSKYLLRNEIINQIQIIINNETNYKISKKELSLQIAKLIDS
jgi:hypothetical protein